MRTVALLVCWLVGPGVVSAQGVALRPIVLGSVGTHLNAGGDAESVAAGLAIGRVDLLVGAERLHIPTDESSFGATRGGTSRFVSGELRGAPFTFGRTSPYVVVGAGRGTSRPTVNERFPVAVANDAWLFFAGAGARVALTRRLSAFADLRASIQGELDTVFLLVPLRGGLAWRF
ncbi:MAG: outer membrane protein [Dehalococcoidia bacterium]